MNTNSDEIFENYDEIYRMFNVEIVDCFSDESESESECEIAYESVSESVVDVVDDDHRWNEFINHWTQISNKGQHNSGIYIKSDTNRLLKVVNHDVHESNDRSLFVNQKLNCEIFPTIYSYNMFRGSKYCIEMTRFDGDITDVLMNFIPLKLIASNEHLSQFEKDDLFELFRTKIPTTYNEYNPLIVRSIGRFVGANLYLSKNNFNEQLTSDLMNYLKKRFANSTITMEMYEQFMKLYNKELQRVLPLIVNRIQYLLVMLKEIDYTYTDCKYDNFGLEL